MLSIFFARCLSLIWLTSICRTGVFPIQWMLFWSALALVVLTIALLLVRRQTFLVQRLTTTTSLFAASLAIFQVNLPFTGGGAADYNVHAERVRR